MTATSHCIPDEFSVPAQKTEGTVPYDTMGRLDDATAGENDPVSLSLPPTTLTILPTKNDVWACQFSVWYPIFSNLSTKYKRRSNVTIKSHVIKPLPPEFIQYLLDQDQRFILPHDTRTSSALLEANHHRDDDNDAWSSSCGDSDRENEPNAVMSKEAVLPSPPTFSFPELNEQIRLAILSFPNQACVPKLNWSSPKDAVWINGNTMECRTAGDIYLLCKASDFITFDLLYARTDVVDDSGDDMTGRGSHLTTSTNNVKPPPLTSTVTTSTANEGDDATRHNPTVQETVENGDESKLNFSFELVLRKFCNLYPSQEFRCFVSFDSLLGISQRHQQYNFPFLQQSRDEYSVLIYDFYESVIQPNVHQMSRRLQQYVVDLYIDQQHRIWIIDFNVWGTRTDATLFHWSELVALSNQAKLMQKQQIRNHPDDAASENSTQPNDTILRRVDFRIVESSSPPTNNNDASGNHHHQQQQPIYPNPLSNYKAPMDALLLSHHGDSTTATTFQDFMKLCVRPSANHNIDDSKDLSSSSSDSDVEA